MEEHKELTDKEIVEKGLQYARMLYRHKYESGQTVRRPLADFLTSDDPRFQDAWKAAADQVFQDTGVDLNEAAARYRAEYARDNENMLVAGITREHVAALERAAKGKCSCTPVENDIRKSHRQGCEVRLLREILDALHTWEFQRHPGHLD